MNYNWSFGFLWEYRVLILEGLGVTVLYTIATNIMGLVIGGAIGMSRSRSRGFWTAPLVAYVELFRCTPLLVQLVWCYYALPVLLGIQIPAHVAAAMTLSLYAGAFYSEIIRGGIVSIDKGQWDAGRALGLRAWPLLRLIIIPQALRRMLPPISNQTVLQLTNTSVISTVAGGALLYQGSIITSATYRPLEVYTLIAVCYFAVLFPMTSAANMLERRLRTS